MAGRGPVEETSARMLLCVPMSQPKFAALVLGAILFVTGHCALHAADVVVPPEIQAIIDNPDRSASDRETDLRRHPGEMLVFFGVKPGQSVLDIGAGRGYTAELLARAVGPEGSVVAQNDTFIFEKFLKSQPDPRFGNAIMQNVRHVVGPYDDPVPEDAGPFDLITIIFVYHDTEWLGRDRQKMNQRLFNALKPGGHLVVVDHAGNPGTGVSQTQTLHRIEENVVRKDMASAGFELAGEAQFLRHPEDPRDQSFRESTSPVDQFVLKFRRP